MASKASRHVSKVSYDVLASMSEDEINRRASFLHGLWDREQNSISDWLVSSAEIEMCYLARELEIRGIRRERHEKYLQEHRYRRTPDEVEDVS